MRAVGLFAIAFSPILVAVAYPDGQVFLGESLLQEVRGANTSDDCKIGIEELSCGVTGGCIKNPKFGMPGEPRCKTQGAGCGSACKGDDYWKPDGVGIYDNTAKEGTPCGKKMKNPLCAWSNPICVCKTQDPGDNGNCTVSDYTWSQCQQGGGSE